MKKNNTLSKKDKQRRREKVFFGVLFGALILVAVLAVVELVMPEEEGMQYLVTGDGHVHTMDGQHIGTVDEFFGEEGNNLVVTEDGHVHTADGAHVGNIAQVMEAPAQESAEAAAQ